MRDPKLDFLRFLGLALIILAHVSPPSYLFQIRNFDVPLMVIIAGASFALSKKQETYWTYFLKRCKRLVLPVWIFLSFYFLSLHLASRFDAAVHIPDKKTIISSYLLLSGIGYVWIIRVFLMISLIAPFLQKFVQQKRSPVLFYLILTSLYCLHEITALLLRNHDGNLMAKAVTETFSLCIPYSLLFILGTKLRFLPSHIIRLAAFAFFAVFIGYALYHRDISGTWVQTQNYKYPPTTYYLSYALAASFFVWLSTPSILARIEKTKFMNFVSFVGQNSIWIYLWHIPFLGLYSAPFWAKYPLVLSSASLFAYLQLLLTKCLAAKIQSPLIRKNVLLIFTG